MSGQMVRAQRASLAGYNVEMGSFLNCNRGFINITQCERIRPEEISNHIPTHIIVGALPEDEGDDMESYIATHFSAAVDVDDNE
jgi:hypothetical protein